MEEDQDLVASALAGGPEAFAPIVQRYQGAVFGVALARVRDFHDAEDIAQSVFVDAFLQLDRLENTARLGAWLRTMAINKSIDRIRRRGEIVDVEEIANEPAHAEMHVALQGSELREQVMEAIGRLGTAQRETITLYYLSGYSLKQVAGIQDAPIGTVKARLHHGRKALKQDMMKMVESTLTSEGPGEDLVQRVLEVLSRHDVHSYDIYRELRRIGAGAAIEGFGRALEASRPKTRRMAAYYAASFAEDDPNHPALKIVKRGLADANREVRFGTILALNHLPCKPEVIRKEIVPLVADLLFDRAKQVRQRAVWFLLNWPADVPLDKATWAMLEEPNRNVRGGKEQLVRAVLQHQSGDAPRISEGGFDDQLTRCREMLVSSTAGVRAGATVDVLRLAMGHPEMSKSLVPLAVKKLEDPARRVRSRAAYELWAWADYVPSQIVEEALNKETNPKTRDRMERLLKKAKQQ